MDVEIPFPRLGLKDDEAKGKQAPLTTGRALNARTLDVDSGRSRGGTRQGTRQFLEGAPLVPGHAVRALASVTYDQRQVRYDAVPEGTVVKSVVLPNKGEPLDVATDREGNVYALDGNNGFAKYNPELELVYQQSVATKDKQAVLRRILVDVDGSILISQAAGSEQSKAAIWKYEQEPDNEGATLVWTIEPGAWVEDMAIGRGGLLYTAQNDTSLLKSALVVYAGIEGINPVELGNRTIPYPVNGVAVKEDGTVFTAHQPNPNRGLNPLEPDASPIFISWTPHNNMAGFRERVWAEFDFAELAATHDEGDDVEALLDIHGSGRGFFRDSTNPVPTYIAPDGTGLSGSPGLRFEQADAADPQYLISGMNQSVDPKYKYLQQTVLPGYTGSAWAVIMVIRAVQNGVVGCMLAQDNTNGAVGPLDHSIWVNRSSAQGGSAAGAATNGDLSFAGNDDGFDQAHGSAAAYAAHGSYSNALDAAIVTVLHDGAQAASQTVVRVNGVPLDLFSSDPNLTQVNVTKTILGRFNDGTGVGGAKRGAKFDLYDLIVFHPGPTPPAGATTLTYPPYRVGSTAPNDTSSDTEVERLEGYYAWKHGLAGLLPDSAAQYPHPYNLENGPPRANGGRHDPNPAANQTSPDGILIKYSGAGGGVVWSTTGGGIGYGVAVGSDGEVYSMGPVEPGLTRAVQRIGDLGDSFVKAPTVTMGGQGPDGEWARALPGDVSPGYRYPRMAVDPYRNLYVPYYQTTARGSSVIGVTLNNFPLLDSSIDVNGTTLSAHAVAFAPQIPNYAGDLAQEDTQIGWASTFSARPEFLYVATEAAGDVKTPTLHRVRLVASSRASGSPRATVFVGAAGGEIRTFNRTGLSIPAGGLAGFDPNAEHISLTTAFGEVFGTDGETYKVFSPTRNRGPLLTDPRQWQSVRTFKAVGAGAVPERFKLFSTWNGRLVGARGSSDPYNWWMSESGNPYGHDYNPVVETAISAVRGNDPRVGPCPDAINGLIPWSDDLLIFLCDHSVYRMTGDPLAGGRFHLVSDITGGAYGRAWCKDPSGLIYFFGSRGGVYVMPPTGVPERITQKRIERRMQSVDLVNFEPRLAYDFYSEGVYVFLLPRVQANLPVRSWFLDLKDGAWWEDEFSNFAHTPTAVMVSDGDKPEDRRILLGCQDGFVRELWQGAFDDDGETIFSEVVIGPLMGTSSRQQRVRGLDVVLADGQGPCEAEVYASDQPEMPFSPEWRGTLYPGRNPRLPVRARGSYIWVRLFSAEPGNRWSYETGVLRISQSGRHRARRSS